MAKITGYLGSSLQRFGRQFVLSVGQSAGVVSTTISADATFDESSAMVSSINGGAASRNVTALASCEIVGMIKAFYNAGSTDNLVIRSSTPSTLATLKPGDWVVLFHNGTTWLAWSTVSAANILAGILATANTWTAAQAFSAAVTCTSTITTTDGVGSGTARKVGGVAYNAIASGTVGPSQGTTELALQTYTIPASTIKAGTRIKGKAAVMVTAQAGATTVLIRARIGGVSGTVIVENSAGWDAAIGDMVIVDFEIVGRAAPGATASVASFGQISGKQAGANAHTTNVSAPYNLATNGSLDLVVTATMSASDATAVACTIFDVEVVG